MTWVNVGVEVRVRATFLSIASLMHTFKSASVMFTGLCRWAWLFSFMCIGDIANQLSVSNKGSLDRSSTKD